MQEPIRVITYDVGTSGVKTSLLEIGNEIELLGSEYSTYGLYILDDGGAEGASFSRSGLGSAH